MKKTVDQTIAELQDKLARAKQKKRAQSTRQKIIVGAAILAEAQANPETAQYLLDILNRRVTRPVDKNAVASITESLKNEQS